MDSKEVIPEAGAGVVTPFERAHAKAEELLKRGDSLHITHPAESRRLLRECRRWRLRARALSGMKNNV